MLYTTYLAKIKSIPEKARKILIMRFLPKHFNLSALRNVVHMPSLAPSERLLFEAKRRGDDWNYYAPRFKEEISQREDMQQALKVLLLELKMARIFILSVTKKIAIIATGLC